MIEPAPAEPGGEPLDVLVAGYASIDIVYPISGPPAPGTTVLLRGPVVPPPRFGGCGPNAALGFARAGCRAGLVTWLGDDAEGAAYRRLLTEAGVDCRGVVVAAGQASPRCLLFVDPDGGTTCCYHPSGSAALRLDGTGRSLAAEAEALAITVGPAELSAALLDARRPGQLLAWNVKADPDAFPPALRRRLLREADVVCLNRDELPFLAAVGEPSPPRPLSRSAGEGGTTGSPVPGTGTGLTTAGTTLPLSRARERGSGGEGSPAASVPIPTPVSRSAGKGENETVSPPELSPAAVADQGAAVQRACGGVVVVTAGSDGCLVVWTDGVAEVPARTIAVADATGAGDAFFAAFVAGILAGDGPDAAARGATDRVAALLAERARQERHG